MGLGYSKKHFSDFRPNLLSGDGVQAKLSLRHSFCASQAPKIPSDYLGSRSDINFIQQRIQVGNLDEYYKKYEHDEVPVKESALCSSGPVVVNTRSLTNKDLDKLETKIFNTISQELQPENSSHASLESNIKFFKTTVQEIFDNFYSNMHDYEHYKKRFHEILAKNQVDAVADMEDFIKDVIHNIISAESSVVNESGSCDTNVCSKLDDLTSMSTKDDATYPVCASHSEGANTDETNNDDIKEYTIDPVNDDLSPVLEAYKNKGYLTDTTMNSNVSKPTIDSLKEDVLNIYLLGGEPCVQIKMNGRNLFSEIHIKDPWDKSTGDSKYVASADNVRLNTAKQIEQDDQQKQVDDDGPDVDIPVKVSYAKKNIHLNEDFIQIRERERSIISRICSFLCRKFRKA